MKAAGERYSHVCSPPDSVAKLPKCRATNFPRKDETSDNRRSMQLATYHPCYLPPLAFWRGPPSGFKWVCFTTPPDRPPAVNPLSIARARHRLGRTATCERARAWIRKRYFFAGNRVRRRNNGRLRD